MDSFCRQNFPKFRHDPVQVFTDQSGGGEQVGIEGVQILFKAFGQDGAALLRQGDQPLFAGMGLFVQRPEDVEIGLHKGGGAVADADGVAPAGGLADLAVIGGEGAGDELSVTRDRRRSYSLYI